MVLKTSLILKQKVMDSYTVLPNVIPSLTEAYFTQKEDFLVAEINELVLIPGLNNTSETWDQVLNFMPDSVKCRPVNVPAFEDINKIAEQLLNSLPEKFSLCGFSFGGFVALAMLEKAPERIERIALVASSASADTEEKKQNREKGIARALAGEHEQMVEAGAHRGFHPNSLQREGLMELRRKIVRDYGPEKYIAHVRACMTRKDQHELLKSANIPILIAAGSDDLVIPTEKQRWLAEQIRQSTFRIIPEAGHMVPLERPDLLAKELQEWLTK